MTLKGTDPDQPGSDYVNANYVSGEVPGSDKRYIATQVYIESHCVMSCDVM